MAASNLLYILLGLSLLVVFPMIMYPLWAWLKSKIWHNRVKKTQHIEPVSIIISCYNEEKYIAQKIQSFLDNSNWIEGSEIIVATGRSTDKTAEVASSFLHTGKISIISNSLHTSKIQAINNLVQLTKNNILVFSDCRQHMQQGTIPKLLSNFADPAVGTVTATLHNTKNKSKNSIFRSILNFCCHCDSNVDACLNVYGALYAQRKSVFKSIPNNILFDDFFVVVSTLSQNKRIIMEKEAVIEDVEFQTYYQKDRIQRLTRGLLIGLFQNYHAIRKLPVKFRVRLFIFKYLKLLMPFALLNLFICLALVVPLKNYFVFIGLVLMALVAFKKTRQLLMLFIQININITSSVFKFFFLNNRQITWNKLNTHENSATTI